MCEIAGLQDSSSVPIGLRWRCWPDGWLRRPIFPYGSALDRSELTYIHLYFGNFYVFKYRSKQSICNLPGFTWHP